MLQPIQDAPLFLRPEKFEFLTQTKSLLRIIGSPGVISKDPKSVGRVTDWETTTWVQDVQEFLGFANFCQCFILGYSRVVTRLTAVTGMGVSFVWSKEAEQGIQNLKTAFITAPVLHIFDLYRPYIVRTDASDYVSASILSQKGN